MRYGFVTFARPCDAYTAIDDSSKNLAIRHYDVSFGGRRAFCREKYFDLGELQTYHVALVFDINRITNVNRTKLLDNTGFGFRCETTTSSPQKQPKESDDSFDVLLRKVKEKLQENKK